MKKTKSISKVLAVALVGGLSMVAQAQVANGPWSSWSPGYSTQIEGCGANSGSTFQITCSKSGSQYDRAERRYDDFSSGDKQFQGTVKVNSLGGDRISLTQCFEDGVGPWNMIAVSKSGTLYQVEGGETIASYTVGSSVRINEVCYVPSAKVVNYVNGSLDQTQTGGTGTYYFKLGTYRTSSGTGPVSATWSSISFYQK